MREKRNKGNELGRQHQGKSVAMEVLLTVAQATHSTNVSGRTNSTTLSNPLGRAVNKHQ